MELTACAIGGGKRNRHASRNGKSLQLRMVAGRRLLCALPFTGGEQPAASADAGTIAGMSGLANLHIELCAVVILQYRHVADHLDGQYPFPFFSEVEIQFHFKQLVMQKFDVGSMLGRVVDGNGTVFKRNHLGHRHAPPTG
jgi:hypothetical protein